MKLISRTVTQSRWYYGAMPVSTHYATAAGEITYRFDTLAPAPAQFIPDGRTLTLYRPAGADDRCRINTRYTLYMQEVQGPAKSFNDHWIELGYYTGWYPVCNGNRARLFALTNRHH